MKNESLIPDTSAEKLERMALKLKTIAHPLRLGLIRMLHHRGAMSVGDICQSLSTEQSLTSHHLQHMRESGIVTCEKQGRLRYYFLTNESVVDLITSLEKSFEELEQGKERFEK